MCRGSWVGSAGDLSGIGEERAFDGCPNGGTSDSGSGLDVLDDTAVAAGHRSSREAVREYLRAGATDPGAAANLILDALTIHEPEVKRIARTLQ